MNLKWLNKKNDNFSLAQMIFSDRLTNNVFLTISFFYQHLLVCLVIHVKSNVHCLAQYTVSNVEAR